MCVATATNNMVWVIDCVVPVVADPVVTGTTHMPHAMQLAVYVELGL